MKTKCIYNYDSFSTTNIEEFENRLINWCKREYKQGKSVLIFDRTSLKVGNAPQIWENENEKFYEVKLNNISLVYICIDETAMCIVDRIVETETQAVMYRKPSKWKGAELWLCE